MVRYFSPFYRFASLLLILLILPTFAVAQQCPLPSPGETKKEIPPEDQKEIPRGTCSWVTIGGRMRSETVSLSLDQTNGSGFHFNQDNGPTAIQASDNQVLICSDSTSCGSASIIINMNGNSIEIGSVRSDSGQWVSVGRITGGCPFTGEPTSRVEGGGVYQDELIVGKWKIWEQKNVQYSCNLLINTGCDCSRCYDGAYCIHPVPCPDGFKKISPFCCRQYPGDGTETIYCISRYISGGPYLHEWRCN